MRFDVHTHHYPAAYFELIGRAGGDVSFATDPSGQRIIRYRGSRFFGVTAPMTDPALRLRDMDGAGVDVAILSLSTPNVFFADGTAQAPVARMVNDAYAEVIATHPERFKGFASIPMDDPDGAVAELHRAIDELGLHGVILLSNIRGRPLTDPAYRPFFAEADRMALCVLLHPMLPTSADAFRDFVLGPLVGFPFDTTLAVARMCYAGMLRDLPNIRWIVAHAGGAIPYLAERLDNGYRDFAEDRAHIDELPSVYLKRLYYDTVTFSPHVLRLLRDWAGADHMAMGSDYPHKLGDITRAVTTIEALDVTAADRELIFNGTARAILRNA